MMKPAVSLPARVAFAFAASVLMFALFPLDLFYWASYGNLFGEIFIDRIAVLHNDLCIQTAYNNLGLVRYFLELVKPVYELPVLFVGLSILFKMVEVFVVERILRCLKFQEKAALVFGVVFLFLNGLSGTSANGLFGVADFNKTFLSSLFSLLGIYFLLKKRHAWGGICLGVACHLHVPYGITSLAFIGSTQLLQSMQTRKFREFIHFSAGAVISILPLMWQVAHIPASENPMGLAHWYRFLVHNGIWGNDTLMSYSIFDVLFFFTTPLCVYLLLRVPGESTKVIDRYLFVGVSVTCLCLLLEYMHSSGFFLGKLSEVFLSIQMRRGVWVPYVMLAFGVFGVVLQGNEKHQRLLRWLLASGALFFLVHSTYEFAALVGAGIGVYLYRNRYPWFWYSAPVAIWTSIALHVYAMEHLIAIAWDAKRLLVLVVMVFASISTVIKPAQRWSASRRSLLGCGIIVMVWFVSRLPNAIKDFQWLNARGWTQPINSTELLERHNGQSEKSSRGYGILLALEKLNPKHDVVFYPRSLGILEGRVPGVFSSDWCALQSMYSYSAASLFHDAAERIYAQPVDSADLWLATGLDNMEKIHNSIPASRISQLFAQHTMGFFISTRFYSEFTIVAQVDEYNIYQAPSQGITPTLNPTPR